MNTLKQVGDTIRRNIKTAQASGDLPDHDPTGYGFVSYAVRVSNSKKSGPAVNITITGYEWLILAYAKPWDTTPGSGSLSEVADDVIKEWFDRGGKELLAKVDVIAGRDRWSPSLAGETKFGICIIGVTPGAVRVERLDA